MEHNAELLRLEELVDQLLTQYSQLKSDYNALEEMLQERDMECADLKATIENLNDERSSVSNRVSGLLDRISQWESEQDSDQAGSSDSAEQADQDSPFSGEGEGQ
ncbi:cell division protein ZapB [Desulfogranum mediterraneum]|uniref:cell division protein ZapB n=1 Tax=Desulfogranum mediterraneum TaxID=160661 RepID=UPI0012947912|nr:cell division protein ZapB [Desulfogranum mediterraneum]